jgi:hypothetical protein
MRVKPGLKSVMLKNRIIAAVFGSALLIGGYAVAQQPAPKKNVSGALHPNLAAAQRLTAQAFTKITAAQEANEFDLAGHAAKAKSLLDQANNELKQAAEKSNANKKQ